MWKIEIDFSPLCVFISKLKLIPTVIIGCLGLSIGLSLNCFYPMENFLIKASVLLFILIIALMAEKQYILITNSITSKLVGSRNNIIAAANAKLERRKKSFHNYWIPCLFISFFGGSAVILKLISLDPLGFFCLFAFVIIVFFSIVGYLQYVYLTIYLKDISKVDFIGSGVNYDRTYPAKTDWLVELTKLYHLYRNRFFITGTLYMTAFYLFTSDLSLNMFINRFNASIDEKIVMLCWIVIFIAIVMLFPISSITGYFNIEKIVLNLKTTEVHRLKKRITKRNKEQEYIPLIISIWETASYPIKDIFGRIGSSIIAVINFAAAVFPVLSAVFLS